jgi:hypothetical protein
MVSGYTMSENFTAASVDTLLNTELKYTQTGYERREQNQAAHTHI